MPIVQTQSNVPAPTGAIPFSKSRASVTLDAVRGIAALLVFTDHWRHVFFLELHELPAHRRLFFLPYVITAAGHAAVVIFFVLSGFLVGGSVTRALDRHRWSWKQYLTHRFVRLWIVLIPALLLGVLWDHFTLRHVLRDPAHSNLFVLKALLPEMLRSRNLPDFLANAAFLQHIRLPLAHVLIPTFGTNGALWSLANEFWYYILFPCVLLAFRKGASLMERAAFALAFLLVAIFVGHAIFFLFPVWLCGVALIYLPKISIHPRLRAFATILYVIAFFLCVSIYHLKSNLSDALLSLFTTAFLWAILTDSTTPAPAGIKTQLPRGLARFSYTLYLVHMPLLYLITSFLVPGAGWTPNARTLAIAFAVWLSILAYAWFIASLTEFHSDQVRSWVERRLGLA